jgi:hypothetical protein
MKRTQVYEWHERFRDGRVSVNGDLRCGRPSASTNNENNERKRNAVRSDWTESI